MSRVSADSGPQNQNSNGSVFYPPLLAHIYITLYMSYDDLFLYEIAIF